MDQMWDEAQRFEALGALKETYPVSAKEEGRGIALDIGTTTVVAAELDLSSGRLLKETKVLNPQRRFGADVISRIQACREYGGRAVQLPLLEQIEKILRQAGPDIKRMYVCGNSTMEHIFLGISPEKISIYLYSCEFEETQTVWADQLFGAKYHFPVVVFPNISAFVGGDTAAGIISTQLHRFAGRMLIDLGTNGEIALSSEEGIYTTSTAAGPAFEGGNMQCGMASIAGAVRQIQIDGGKISCRTIGDERPAGICGSGYIEGISEILSHGLMDETGYMEKEITVCGQVRITPADIRNFQLAKSAIRSGINILCRRAGIDFSSIDKVYISGGFGRASKLACLANLKIIPEEFAGKTELLGNTALDGAIRLLLTDSDEGRELMSRVKAMCRTVDLASDPDFNEEYMKNMWF